MDNRLGEWQAILLRDELEKCHLSDSDLVFDAYDVQDKRRVDDLKQSLLMEAVVKPQDDTSLIALCRLETRRNKGITRTVLLLAFEALRRRETYDALAYLGKGILIHFANEGHELINALSAGIQDEQLRNFCRVFDACLFHYEGDYQQFESLIDEFRLLKNANFDPYLSRPVADIRTHPAERAVRGEAASSLPEVFNAAITNPSHVVSASCDSRYLDLYGRFFLESWFATQRSDSILMLSVVGQNKDWLANWWAQLNLDPASKSRIHLEFWFVESEVNIGPIAASLRLLNLARAMECWDTAASSVDLDSVFLAPVNVLLERHPGADVALREIHSKLSWERFAAGYVGIRNSPVGLAMAQYLNSYLSTCLRQDRVQWWIDQNAIESSRRAVEGEFAEPRFANVYAERDQFLVQPTGTAEFKNRTLSAALEDVRRASAEATTPAAQGDQ